MCIKSQLCMFCSEPGALNSIQTLLKTDVVLRTDIDCPKSEQSIHGSSMIKLKVVFAIFVDPGMEHTATVKIRHNFAFAV